MNNSSFIKITDNIGEIFYINKNNIAYLKQNCPNNSSKSIFKIVLKNDKHIIIPDFNSFSLVRDELFDNGI